MSAAIKLFSVDLGSSKSSIKAAFDANIQDAQVYVVVQVKAVNGWTKASCEVWALSSMTATFNPYRADSITICLNKETLKSTVLAVAAADLFG